MLRTIILIALLFTLKSTTNAKAFLPDWSPGKNAIKFDFVTVYNTIFDIRKQYRLGLEYETRDSSQWSQCYHLDFGVFDKYKFYRYYSFYDEDAYHEMTAVKTYGFHFLYSLKYTFKRSLEKKLRYFAALTADANFFKRKNKEYSSQTLISDFSKQHQFRLGIGPDLGVNFSLFKRFTLELKSAMLFKVYTWKSNKEGLFLRPNKAVWYGTQHDFWILPRINLGYEF